MQEATKSPTLVLVSKLGVNPAEPRGTQIVIVAYRTAQPSELALTILRFKVWPSHFSIAFVHLVLSGYASRCLVVYESRCRATSHVQLQCASDC